MPGKQGSGKDCRVCLVLSLCFLAMLFAYSVFFLGYRMRVSRPGFDVYLGCACLCATVATPNKDITGAMGLCSVRDGAAFVFSMAKFRGMSPPVQGVWGFPIILCTSYTATSYYVRVLSISLDFARDHERGRQLLVVGRLYEDCNCDTRINQSCAIKIRVEYWFAVANWRWSNGTCERIVRYNVSTLKAILQEERRGICEWVNIGHAEISLGVIGGRNPDDTNAVRGCETTNDGAEMFMTKKCENDIAMADGRHAKEAREKIRLAGYSAVVSEVRQKYAIASSEALNGRTRVLSPPPKHQCQGRRARAEDTVESRRVLTTKPTAKAETKMEERARVARHQKSNGTEVLEAAERGWRGRIRPCVSLRFVLGCTL